MCSIISKTAQLSSFIYAAKPSAANSSMKTCSEPRPTVMPRVNRALSATAQNTASNTAFTLVLRRQIRMMSYTAPRAKPVSTDAASWASWSDTSVCI